MNCGHHIFLLGACTGPVSLGRDGSGLSVVGWVTSGLGCSARSVYWVLSWGFEWLGALCVLLVHVGGFCAEGLARRLGWVRRRPAV